MTGTGLTRRRFVFGALAVGATTLAAACAPSAPTVQPTSGGAAPQVAPTTSKPASSGGSMAQSTVALPADAPTLDPQKPGGPYGDDLRFNIFDSLAFYDASGKVVPWLATAWNRMSDTQWRYT